MLNRGTFFLTLFAALGNSIPQTHAQTRNAEAQGCSGALTPTNVEWGWVQQQIEADANLTPEQKRLRDAVQKAGLKSALRNRELLARHNEFYSRELCTGPVTDQKDTTRCWIFAAQNVLRSQLIAKNKVPSNFEFSESYIWFYALLERANTFIEHTAQSAFAGAAQGTGIAAESELYSDIADGGWFETFAAIATKYGLAPKGAMRETSPSALSGLANELSRLLSREAVDLNASVQESMQTLLQIKKQNVSEEDLSGVYEKARARKTQLLNNVWRVLATHLGSPPARFTFEGRSYTPQQFAQSVGFDASEWIVVSANPSLTTGRYYSLEGTAEFISDSNMRSEDHKRLNLTPDRMQELVMRSIDHGVPVWFAADVLQDLDPQSGILHPEIFMRDAVYGTESPEADKKRAELRPASAAFALSQSMHAMTFVGYDKPEGAAKAIKFKVENSWGSSVGSSGFLHLYREWFERNVFEVVVPRSILSEAERAQLEREPVVLSQSD